MPIRVLTVLVLALVGACGDEKPDQQLVQSEERASARDQRSGEDTRRQRTLGQSESERIYNQGALR